MLHAVESPLINVYIKGKSNLSDFESWEDTLTIKFANELTIDYLVQPRCHKPMSFVKMTIEQVSNNPKSFTHKTHKSLHCALHSLHSNLKLCAKDKLDKTFYKRHSQFSLNFMTTIHAIIAEKVTAINCVNSPI